MCIECGHDLKDSYLNWLRHHEPDKKFTSTDENILYTHSITILLTLRMQPITVEEIRQNFPTVSENEAKVLELSVNKIIDDLEDQLIESMKN